MLYVVYALMALCILAGIGGAAKSKKGSGGGKAIAGLAAVAAVGLALVAVVMGLARDPADDARDAVRKIAQSRTDYSVQGFGKAVAENLAGEKALLVTLPTVHKPQEQHVTEVMEKAFGSSVEIVAVWNPVDTGPPDPSNPTFCAANLDAQVSKSGATLVVSLIGLPMDYEELDFLRQEPRPKLALHGSAQHVNLKGLIENGYAQVATISSPSFNPSNAAPDPNTYFDSRYITVTPKNLAQHAKDIYYEDEAARRNARP
jgi:hypothetical protein